MLTDARIPFSFIAKKVARDATVVILFIGTVAFLRSYFSDYVPAIPISIPAFVGTAISLILSFKLSQSYDRWWEARKVWGAIVNDSRSFARKSITFADGAPTEVTDKMVRRQIAWCHVLSRTLRGLDWQDRALRYLDEDDLGFVRLHSNPALAILQLHGQDLTRLLRTGALTDFQRVSLEETLTRLTDWMGMAERIKHTVFPRTYRIFLHSFILVFVFLISLALTGIPVWGEIISFVVAISFFLLEKTATHMQDPFSNRPSDTATTAIATTIEINLLQLIGEKDVPPPAKPEGFYLM